jgi:glycosyltransferase involved in cell wall biosynthesis
MLPEYIAHERIGRTQRAILHGMVTPLRTWDFAAAQRPDHFVANSRATAGRIAKYYRRPATVIEPPINAAEFAGGDGAIEPYFLIVSRLQSYKRLDLAIAAAAQAGARLRIAGRGPDEQRLRALAGPGVEFLGKVSDAERVRLFQRCAALIVPGREDFGLTALEVQAAGRPVIAYGAGGALETVIEGVTGVFFREQTFEALAVVLRRFDPAAYDARRCREQALRFDVAAFRRRLQDHLDTLVAAHREAREGEAP